MILYNVTVTVDESIHQEWLQWMTEIHIAEVMATGRFTEWKMFRVLFTQNDEITYAIQYFAHNLSELQRYQANNAQELQAKHQLKFANKVLAFRTVLEQV